MKKKILIAAIILASSSVYADYNIGDVSGGEFKVYSETITSYKGHVRFTLGIMNKDNSIDTEDNVVNCATHKTIEGQYLAPETVLRVAADYACNYTNNSSSSPQPETGVVTAWTVYNSYGQRLKATDEECPNKVLLNDGYEFKITSAIPVSRLHNNTDAYIRDDRYAITVIGCWSAKNHMVSWHRKSDGKDWSEPFKVTNEWTKSYE